MGLTMSRAYAIRADYRRAAPHDRGYNMSNVKPVRPGFTESQDAVETRLYERLMGADAVRYGMRFIAASDIGTGLGFTFDISSRKRYHRRQLHTT